MTKKYFGKISKNFHEELYLYDVFLIFVNRRHELKFWGIISQLDDFIMRFLGIEYNHRRENWQHIGRTLFCILLAFLIGTILSEAGFSTTDNYERFCSSSFYFLLLKQWHVYRYIFYVTVLSNRIKILIENYEEIAQCNYKLHTVHRVYMIICKLSQKIDQIFGWQMLAIVIDFVVISLFIGFLLSVDLAVDSANIAHLFSLVVSQLIIWYMCIICNRLKNYVGHLGF